MYYIHFVLLLDIQHTGRRLVCCRRQKVNYINVYCYYIKGMLQCSYTFIQYVLVMMLKQFKLLSLGLFPGTIFKNQKV